MRHTRRHLLIAGLLLAAVAVLVPLPGSASWPAHLLLGWVAGSATFSIPVLVHSHRMDAAATAQLFEGADGGRTETDVIVVLAAFASLAAIGVMLIAGGGSQSFEAILTVLSVAAGWVAVHSVYTLRYARHYLVDEPECIDFEGGGPPRLSDFAYLSFTLGMTYQVSDTGLRTSEIRRIVLRHTLLSYLFGTVIVAATINLVVGLASGGGGS